MERCLVEDLADFSAEWVEPISTTYRGWTVYEIPPNGQGIAALEMLNIMETFRFNDFRNPADVPHVMIEAKKLAYADMLRYVADQKFSTVPVAGMLSKEYAAQRAKLIDMAKANCDVAPGEPEFPAKGDTTYLTVVDRDGNMVSLIQSNYARIRLRSSRRTEPASLSKIAAVSSASTRNRPTRSPVTNVLCTPSFPAS